MSKKQQTNRFRLFYYSHPYVVIFNILIIWNLIVIALAALAITLIFVNNDSSLTFTWDFYLKNLQYCTVFTMNSGGIYDQAPNAVVVIKIILVVIQMVTFTGALVGFATSLLQSMFDRRVHNVGRLKLKNHYVILNWSPEGANLLREFSFKEDRKVVVILSEKSRDEINEEIDNLFLETGTERKGLTVFVKQGNPSSRKCLKEISINKAKSVAILVDYDTDYKEVNATNDVKALKLLMNIVSITKDVNVIIESENEKVMNNIKSLVSASPDLKNSPIYFFSRDAIIGNLLARSAIDSEIVNIYYNLLTYKNGSFYKVKSKYDVSEALGRYANAIPVKAYPGENNKNDLYVLASSYSKTAKRLSKVKYENKLDYKENLNNESFTLFIIGKNSKSENVLRQIGTHNLNNENKIVVKNYDFNDSLDQIIKDIKECKNNKKVLVLSDEYAVGNNIDNNVFISVLKLKASKDIPSDLEISTEIRNPFNRSSLQCLNVSNIIISNQLVALYLVQLMSNEEGQIFYHNFLSSKSDVEMSFEVRRADELFSFKDRMEFNSKGEFVYSAYVSSKQAILPIGVIGEKDKKDVMDFAKNTVGNVVGATSKLLSSVTNALTLNETTIGELVEESDISLFSDKFSKKQKLTIYKDSKLIIVRYY